MKRMLDLKAIFANYDLLLKEASFMTESESHLCAYLAQGKIAGLHLREEVNLLHFDTYFFRFSNSTPFSDGLGGTGLAAGTVRFFFFDRSKSKWLRPTFIQD